MLQRIGENEKAVVAPVVCDNETISKIVGNFKD
jgi:hypothetical protein